MSAEMYKGIEFIRISNLPDDQKIQITRTIDNYQIIKIQRGKDLLPDCIQLADYTKWLTEKFIVITKN